MRSSLRLRTSGFALRLAVVVPALALLAGCGSSTTVRARHPPPVEGWQSLEAGLELGSFRPPGTAVSDDDYLRVLRIDPRYFDLRLLNASALDGERRTARQWSREHGLVAALNASMYQEDYRTSVSMMRTSTHTNNAHLTLHRAVLAFDRTDPEFPAVKIIDLECDDFDEWRPRYTSFVQSIRMLSCTAENVWEQQPRKWSTAAVGLDGAGRVLFVHARFPFTTHDLIDVLVGLPLDLRTLMYTEGGHEAQLYVDSPEHEYEFVGSFEKAFGEADDNHRAWPVPNVLGIVRRAPE